MIRCVNADIHRMIRGWRGGGNARVKRGGCAVMVQVVGGLCGVRGVYLSCISELVAEYCSVS